MIHVQRGSAPAVLKGGAVAKLMAMLRSHYAQPPEKRPPLIPPKFPPTALRETRAALFALFRGKCAFCESQITDAGYADIERFRPRGGVSESSGSYLGDHYWAQSFAWENLYLACANCNRSKANRFPLEAGSPRAAADADRRALALERPLLLDPCADDPDEHLLFSIDGTVAGLTDRGLATIEILDLNRSSLCDARKAIAAPFASMLEKAGAAARALHAKKLSLPTDAPYLALRRQILRASQAQPLARERERQAKQAQAAFDSEREAVDTASAKGLEHFRSRARYIERVRVQNISSIKDIELDLQASASKRAPCFALLGNNGVGKSSVLKSIALALAGPAYVERLGLQATQLLADHEASGLVRVWLSGYREPVEMHLTRRGNRIRFTRPESLQLVLGYGSSRLLPTAKHRPPAGQRHAKIDNLFDPFLPLTDAQAWLATPRARERWADVQRTLVPLLPADGEHDLPKPARASQPVRLTQKGREPRLLRELSDGYQSMLGLAADILEIVYGLGWESARAAQGVVLIDELGNHLHPAWRMRVVGALRAAFPQVQFIYSTHDPLCLRGLMQGEVAVMRLNARRSVQLLRDLPTIEGLRVDQLLTSEHFGLDSTLDPDTEAAMKRYRELLGTQRRSAAQTRELAALRGKLDNARMLGSNARERLMLEAIDRDSALRRPITEAPAVSVQALAEDTVAQLRALMKRMRASA
ncbi:MAG: AAA family ATPase [Rubrivivax sp.]